MKKIGLFKRIGLATATATLCSAMAVSCLTTSAFNGKAYAEEPADATAAGEVTVINEANRVTVKDTCKYGDQIAVPSFAGVEVSVIAPNGDEATVTNGKVTANQIGIYKVRYSNSDLYYDFNVKVTLDEDYFLYVDYKGADIPTYIEGGKSFTLPKASVKYYDDDNVLQPYDGDVVITAEDTTGKTYNVTADSAESRTFTAPTTTGKVYLTYTARIGGEDGTKILTNKYTVNVQSKVTRQGNPVITVSGIQSDASINRPVTLPTAKVTDNTDDNVKVVIEVIDPVTEKPVKLVNVDENGYATSEKDADVVFDNDKSMTFYPTHTGTYIVRYTAYNDMYDENNPSAGGKSGTKEAQIKVADHVAPVFKETYEYLIPETWGLKTVTNANGNVENAAGKITFQVPEVVDNYDHAVATDEDDKNLISMYFRITDSDNSRTVVEFNNILATDDNSKYTATSTSAYGEDKAVYTFNKANPFTFDFNLYNRKTADGKDEATSLTGTYTVLFRARDKANNTSSKTYTITLRDTYEDKAAPSSAEVTVPEYISVADETFTVPYPVYADAADSRPYKTYRIYTDATVATGTNNWIEVDGGEVADIVAESDIIEEGRPDASYLVIDKGETTEKKLLIGENLYFYIGVKDVVGNFKSNVEDNTVDLTAEGVAADAYKNVTAKIKVIGDTSEQAYDYTGNIAFANANPDATEIKEGDTVKAGGFSIKTANLAMRNYTGFEVAVYDPQNNPIDFTLETVSAPAKDDADHAMIYVQNISFNVSTATAEDEYYSMIVRVFDVNGNSSVFGYKLTGVLENDNTVTHPSATPAIGSSGEVYNKYKLTSESDISIVGKGPYRLTRKITGRRFSLMGSEFISMTAGSYSVQTGAIDDELIENGTFPYGQVNFSGANKGVKNFDITNTATPVIELQDVMPSYVDKKDEAAGKTGKVTLPKAIAYTENGMGVIKVTVMKGTKEVKFDEEDYSFIAEEDGVYTVKYVATYAGANTADAEYTISAGDVIAPIFTLSGGSSVSSTKKEGDTFKYKTITLADENEKGVTITKEIYDPSRNLISANTVDGTYSSNNKKENNGSEIKLNAVGEYTIVYTAKDSVGNEYKLTETVTVASSGSSTPTTWTTLSTVLIIVAVVLLAGVIVYVVRFRKVKK